MASKRTVSGLKVADLFSGAGLFSYAFLKSGFRIVDAVELESHAASTYASNIGTHVRCGDVTKSSPKEECDVLIAGPPCQGFSTLGKRDRSDSRNNLSFEVHRWAKSVRPKVIVIENVPAFLESRVWRLLSKRFSRLGYRVTATVLNASDFGAPQIRRRSFTFATRVGIPRVNPPITKPVQTVRDAWEGLPRRATGKNSHYSPKPSPLALARMEAIPSGGDKRDILRDAPHLAPPSWHKVRGEVTDVWGRMEWDKPSNTLRTCLQNPSKGRYIHPEQHRVISLREAARLQTIPDEWQFVGTPYQVARQIGNSVPPALGLAVARAVSAVF